MHLAPGAPIRFFAGDAGGLSSDEVERIRGLYGLDQPPPIQYLSWLAHLATFDFGTSYISHRPVLSLILQRLPGHVPLTLTAPVFGTIVGVGPVPVPSRLPRG